MVRVLIALLIAVPLTWAQFSHEIPIAIDHTMVAGAVTDFPIPVDITSDDLKTVGNGGLVRSASGLDIVLYGVSGCASGKLDYEPLRNYDGAVGRVQTFAKIPNLTTDGGQFIYACVGDASISTFQGNGPGVWSNGFVAVYHLSDGSAATGADALGNYPMTVHGVSHTTGGFFGRAVFDGVDDYLITTATHASPFTSVAAISVWLRRSSTGRRSVFAISSAWQFEVNQNADSKHQMFFTNADSTTRFHRSPTDTILADADYHLAGEWSRYHLSGGTRLYRNGDNLTLEAGGNYSANDIATPTNNWYIGAHSTAGREFGGQLWEMRLHGTYRGGVWWANEHSTANPLLLSAGSPNPLSPPEATRRVLIIN